MSYKHGTNSLHGESGQSTIEYALVCLLVAIGTAVALEMGGCHLQQTYNALGSAMNRNIPAQ